MYKELTPARFSRIGMLACGMVLAALALAGSASAASRDVNHDGLPDRWERKHKLSLKFDQARNDQDRDGVANECEYAAHTNPKRRDSDRDGRRDGAEDSDHDGLANADESDSHSDCGDRDSDDDGVRDDDEMSGQVVAYDPATGSLTIELFTGETVTGVLSPTAEIECESEDDDHASAPTTAASVSRDGGGEDDDGDRPDDDSPGGSAGGHHEPDDESSHCATAAIVAGAVVKEAKLVDGVFVKVHLIV